jgi:hypothetical protein
MGKSRDEREGGRESTGKDGGVISLERRVDTGACRGFINFLLGAVLVIDIVEDEAVGHVSCLGHDLASVVKDSLQVVRDCDHLLSGINRHNALERSGAMQLSWQRGSDSHDDLPECEDSGVARGNLEVGLPFISIWFRDSRRGTTGKSSIGRC